MVTASADGTLLFRIYLPHADSVEIRGTFNRGICGAASGSGGEPTVAMECTGDGWWSARLRVPPGEHTFCYLLNGQGSMPDYAADGLALDAGGAWVSCLSVAEPSDLASVAPDQGRVVARATLTPVQVRQLASGEQVEVSWDADPSRVIVLRAAAAEGGPVRMPRPDRPVERRRETSRPGRRGSVSSQR